MASVELDGINKVYENGFHAVQDLSIDVADGEFLVLVGPSGCGKSTALRMVAGLEDISSGELRIGGKRVNDLDPQDRDIAMVFQSYALYPHMTVGDNMAYGLKLRKMPKDQIAQRVNKAAEMLELTPLLERRPAQLSGGQRQRVAMGRAIVREPQVFLMDEPLSNLDAKLRVQTRTQIAKLQRDLGVTTVYVTHDQTEAMTMGDRIAVLKDGLLMQVGTPQDLYDTPANVFVAGFIGSPAMNILEAPVANGKMQLGAKSIDLPASTVAALAGGTSVVVGMRPEDLRISDGPDAWPVEVQIVEGLGADAYVYTDVALPGGNTHQVVVRTDGRQHPTRGSVLNVEAIAHHTHFFSPATGERLPNG